jgi:hypothetical protein
MGVVSEVRRDPRGQGERGEQLAATWFVDRQIDVFVPLLHTPRDCDFIVDWGEGPKRVQVKTATFFRNGRWEVLVCTRGGNQSWTGVAKLLDASKYDYLFVHVADGRRWLIPSSEVGGAHGIRLGGPKYAQWELEPGEPLAISRPALDSRGPWRDSRAVKGARL